MDDRRRSAGNIAPFLLAKDLLLPAYRLPAGFETRLGLSEDLVERCVTCMYYDRLKAGGEAKAGSAGQCRRNGPVLSPINQKSYMIEGVWPTVRDDDWCGEWKALQRRVDTSRLGDVLNTPLSTPFPGAPPQPPRVTTQAARAALGAFTNEVRPASVSTLPLAPFPLPALNTGNRSGD
jgi:hypothetical protein